MTRLADVVPFRGLRYNRESVKNLAPVISPPYDIISPADQQRFHDKHAYNAIHLDFGLEDPGDSENDNRYTRAAATLDRWLAEKILRPDPEPAFYLCREEFQLGDGSPASREGFIALVRLADFSEGVVLPHEETASGPKEDRLKLMRATEANLSAIYCLYADPGHGIIKSLKEAASTAPDAQLTDEAGTKHSLWVVDDPDATSAVNSMLADKTLLIADGHHRYETSLAYRDARRAGEPDPSGADKPYDFLMVYLSDMENTGQSILPIHRFVSGLSAGTVENLVPSLSEKFEVKKVSGTGEAARKAMIGAIAQAGDGHNVFGMYLPGPDSCFMLTGRQPRPMTGAEANGRSAAYRSLDIAVLDRVILTGTLGIRPGGPNEAAKVRFVERTEAALEAVDTPGLDVAFFVDPTTMAEIRAVADAGEKMPEKSTYFYPKPVTGMVFRSFRF